MADGGRNFDIVVKHKGAVDAKLTFTGKSAHSSTPWEGDNAIEKMINTLPKIKAIISRY